VRHRQGAAAIMPSMRSEQPVLPGQEQASIGSDGAAPGGTAPRGFLRRLAPYLVVTMIANTAIAVMLSIALPQSHHTFVTHFVFS
jgi:hypothetical protein